MNDTQKITNKEFNDIDQALHRAALRAKEEAEKNGTPYVVAETKNNHELQQGNNANKQ
ncbi:MAG: hypothetical protein HOP21_08880 [Methylotenera sp.]|nr:hypothetical protein [Methylotenera sp.]